MSNYFPVTYSTLSAEALATTVLPNYALGTVVEFSFLSFGVNDTYLYKTADGEKYILRVYRRGWRSLPDIAYEVEALNHLSRKGVTVSKPLPQKDGQFIQAINAPEGTRYAVLFSYATGSGPSPDKAEQETFTYGQTAAKLHNAIQDFTSPHARFHLDLDHLLEAPLKSIGPLLAQRPADWAYLQQLAAKIRQQLHTLPSEALEQGFCHGDFHFENAHFAEDGTITLFDFDCCGWGWRAYDLATFRWIAKLFGQEKERWEPFLRGYTTERSLQPLDLQAIPLFMGIRHFWFLGLRAGNAPDWGVVWANDQIFDSALQFLKAWETECFAETPPTQA